MLNILVVSDKQVLQRLLRCLFSHWLPDGNLIVTEDQASARALNTYLQPDFLVLDISVPTRSCLRFIKGMKADNRKTSMLLLCNHTYGEYFDAAIPTGIDGCFDIASDTFVDDLRRRIVSPVEAASFSMPKATRRKEG